MIDRDGVIGFAKLGGELEIVAGLRSEKVGFTVLRISLLKFILYPILQPPKLPQRSNLRPIIIHLLILIPIPTTIIVGLFWCSCVYHYGNVF